MDTLNKKMLSEILAENFNLTKKDSADIVNLLLDEIQKALREGKTVELKGLGKFEVKTRKARTAINLKTREKIQVPDSSVVKFKVSKLLKDAVKDVKVK